MKNVILINRGALLLDEVLSNTNWIVVLLIVDSEIEKNKYLNNERILEIYTVQDLLKNEDVINIDYIELEKYKKAQVLVENQHRRFDNDYQMAKYNYYTGVSFWIGVFNRYEIDLVIQAGIVHGFNCDCIPREMAISRNIPTYNIQLCTANKRIVYNNCNEHIVEIINEKTKKLSFKEDVFYSMPYDQGSSEYLFSCGSLWKKYILKIAYKVGGMLLWRFLIGIRTRRFQFDLHYTKLNYFLELKQFLKSNQLKKYVNSISKEPDYNRNFIFFAMNCEPDATVPGLMDMDSQLIAIKILSESLPDGWMIYVKEHPYQYELNNILMEYYIPSVPIFKSKLFYDTINSISNVKIINPQIPSKNLIKNSMGIATMCGTIALEAISYKKPILLFAAKKTVYSYCKDFFDIRSFEDCKKAVNKIKKGYSVDYRDFDEIANKYMVNDNKYGLRLAIKSIIKELEKDN